MMQHQAYDLALIDYQLPEIDGLASARLTKYLLGDAKRPRLIAVTGQADALTAQDGPGNTFDAILPKPFDLAIAIRLVEDQLATTRAASPLHRRWEAFGLTEAPSAVVYPVIDRERLSILSQYFDVSGRSEPQAILLADAAGAAEIEMLKLNGDLWTLPVIDLSGAYESIADASFSDHDRQDWARVAEAIRQFKKRRTTLAPQSLQTCDLSTRLLVYLHLAGRNWAPVRDASVTSCLRYPGFFPTADVQACAQRLYAKGLLERTFIDRLHVCPSCASSRLNAREECLSCRSPNLTETSIIHHYRCAHQAIEDEFVQGRDLVCPKCRQHLRHYGNDYDKPGHALICGECSATHSDAAVGFVCFDCGAHCDGEAIPRRDVFAYQLTAAAYATITAHTSPALRSRLPGSLPDDLVDELERQSANDDAPVSFSIVEVHYAARSALVNTRWTSGV